MAILTAAIFLLKVLDKEKAQVTEVGRICRTDVNQDFYQRRSHEALGML